MTSSLWEFFKCQQCGKCCEEIGLPYNPESIFKLADFLNISVDQVIERYYGRFLPDGKSWESEDHKRTPCPFLKSEEDKKICEIYPVRPKGCELYPLETDAGRGDVDCPAAKIVFDKRKLNEINGIKEDENMTYSLELDFIKPGKGDIPSPPHARIYVKTYSRDEKDHILITPNCVNLQELEYHIGQLHKELEDIKKKAKSKFEA